MADAQNFPSRLYKDVTRSLIARIGSGELPVGKRLPAERELAVQYNVSRPTIREAIIALEVQGFVEVRVKSGVYVKASHGLDFVPEFNVSAIELTEARLLVEGEVAALAAASITAPELSELRDLVRQIQVENLDPSGTERADRAFHIALAQATRNQALIAAVERLWDLRSRSPEASLLHEKARSANVKPVVEEHSAVVEALAAKDPAAARAAMHAHLSQVLESLLFATEQKAIENARSHTQERRDILANVRS